MKDFKDVQPDANGLRRLRLLQDAQARDNCWNEPKNVTLKKGDVLTAVCIEGTERGDFFFQVNDTKLTVSLRPPAYQTRYPYDVGQFNPDYLTEI